MQHERLDAIDGAPEQSFEAWLNEPIQDWIEEEGTFEERAQAEVDIFEVTGQGLVKKAAERHEVLPDNAVKAKLTELNRKAQDALERALFAVGEGVGVVDTPLAMVKKLQESGEKADKRTMRRFIREIERFPHEARSYLEVFDFDQLDHSMQIQLVELLMEHRLQLVDTYFDELGLSPSQQERYCREVFLPTSAEPKEYLQLLLIKRIPELQIPEQLKQECVEQYCIQDQDYGWKNMLDLPLFTYMSQKVRQEVAQQIKQRLEEGKSTLLFHELKQYREQLALLTKEQRELLVGAIRDSANPSFLLFFGKELHIDVTQAKKILVSIFENYSVIAEGLPGSVVQAAIEQCGVSAKEIAGSVLHHADRSTKSRLLYGDTELATHYIDCVVESGDAEGFDLDQSTTTELISLLDERVLHEEYFITSLVKASDLLFERVDDWSLPWVQKKWFWEELSVEQVQEMTSILIQRRKTDLIEILCRKKLLTLSDEQKQHVLIAIAHTVDSRGMTARSSYLETFIEPETGREIRGVLIDRAKKGDYEALERGVCEANLSDASEELVFTKEELTGVIDELESLDNGAAKSLVVAIIRARGFSLEERVVKKAYQLLLDQKEYDLIVQEFAKIIVSGEIKVESRVIFEEYVEKKCYKKIVEYKEFLKLTAEDVTRLLDVSFEEDGLSETIELVQALLTPEDAAISKSDLERIFDFLIKQHLNSLFYSARDRFMREGIRPDVMRLFDRIAQSPSQAMQRIKFSLSMAIAHSENPMQKLEEIERIFTGYNLPDVGKMLKVFEALFIDGREGMRMGAQVRLAGISKRGMRMTAYRELVRIHIDSNNASLRTYLESIQSAAPLLDIVDAQGVDALDEYQMTEFLRFCKKMQTLYDQSLLGRTDDHQVGEIARESALKQYEQLRESIGVKEGQSTIGRLERMFLRPAGFESIQDALERMDEARQSADARGRQFAHDIEMGNYQYGEGSFIKAFFPDVLRSMLSSGCVAREFLGAAVQEDLTPLNTDLVEASATLHEDLVWLRAYGEVGLLVRDRGQFARTDKGEKLPLFGRRAAKQLGKYELFTTGVVSSEHHVGISTGIASSEIDALVISPAVTREKEKSLFMDTVMAGWYIPIIDTNESLLYTPAQFDEARARFLQGLPEMGGGPFVFADMPGSRKHTENIDQIMREKREDRERSRQIRDLVMGQLHAQLSEIGVSWRENPEEMLFGADLHETGSMSRATNRPKDYDFDYALRLDLPDYENREALQDKISKILRTFGGAPQSGDRVGQLRFVDVKIPGLDFPVGIDLAFTLKAETPEFSSHQAVSDRLKSILATHGEEAYERVVANILFAKQFLTTHGIYKKLKHGLGGIGVENWILSHGGDFLSAAKAFVQASSDKGRRKDFDEFRRSYSIIDPGIDIKSSTHDDFVAHLNKESYLKMCEVLGNYLAVHTGYEEPKWEPPEYNEGDEFIL